MKNNNSLSFVALIISMLVLSSQVFAKVNVVTSIKPIHSIVASVMEGIGEPSLIVDGNASPHTFQFKPSHAKMLQRADIIFWVDKDLESFLEKPLNSIAKKAKKISLMDLSTVKKLKFREKNIFVDSHKGHKDHDDHKGHKDKGHKDHDDHKGHKDHDDHKGHEGHAHGEYDVHIWLDPENAKIMSLEIAKELSKIDPSNKSIYESNAKKFSLKINEMIKEIKKEIKKDSAFVVFHDAYQYFEKRFDVNVVGALTVNPEVLPGAKQLAKIREEIEHEKVKCLFSEPQFNPNIAKAIAKDTGIKIAVIDPLGANLNPSKNLYIDLIKSIAGSFKNC